jgi:hypothetical protein
MLPGSQEITPAPYALYAVEAGGVDWMNVTNRPAGLDDGDDDTTYSPGFGLDLEGTTFNVMTDTLQARITGDCEVGSTIRVVNPDGSVTCESHDTKPLFSVTPLEDNCNHGDSTSVAIGADGLPIISYGWQNPTYSYNLKVAHCNNSACTSAEATTIDNYTSVGYGNAIAIGADGLPIISYFDESNDVLKVARCSDIACKNVDLTTVDSDGEVGLETSITIGVDGLPIISYYRRDSGDLKVAHCDDISCTSATTSTIDASGETGRHSSIAIGIDGLPIISYLTWDSDDLKVAHCEDISCTNASINTLDNGSVVGNATSISIGSDGLPIIGYINASNLIVAHCNDISCSSASLHTVDTGQVQYLSLSIGNDGLPVLSYKENIVDGLKVAHCNDLHCSSSSTIPVDIIGITGYVHSPSIVIGMDGFPFISYFEEETNCELKVIHCSNINCLPYAQP